MHFLRFYFNKFLCVGEVLILFPLVFLSCTKKAAETKSEVAADPITRGRQIYQSTCVACHNSDPKKAGSLGPDVFGSTFGLIEARVMRAEYPAGYKPKRSTKVMVALPQFKDDLGALAAYLNAKE